MMMSSRGLRGELVGMRHLGCTRVSTATQDAQLQVDTLLAAGVQQRDVFSDVTSGRRTTASGRG